MQLVSRFQHVTRLLEKGNSPSSRKTSALTILAGHPVWTEIQYCADAGVHEVRPTPPSVQACGQYGQKIAGHTTEGMTRNYQKGHENVVWSEVEADLNIGDFAG